MTNYISKALMTNVFLLASALKIKSRTSQYHISYQIINLETIQQTF